MEIKKIDAIEGYHANPRKITEKMFNLLGETIQEYGDLSGIVVDSHTGEVIGGNQRTAFFKQHADDVKIHIEKKFDKPTEQGTVAIGYLEFKGERFSYREVSWDKKKIARANIIANKVGGFWDNDVLANHFDIEDLKYAGFEDFELGFATEEIDFDNPEDLTKTMDSYLEGSIKQIVIFFTAAQFEDIVPRLQAIEEELGTENHTDTFIKLLEFYEQSK